MRFGLGILGLRQTRVRARAIDLGVKMHSFEAVGSNKHRWLHTCSMQSC